MSHLIPWWLFAMFILKWFIYIVLVVYILFLGNVKLHFVCIRWVRVGGTEGGILLPIMVGVGCN